MEELARVEEEELLAPWNLRIPVAVRAPSLRNVTLSNGRFCALDIATRKCSLAGQIRGNNQQSKTTPYCN